jgi:hypothetical protein
MPDGQFFMARPNAADGETLPTPLNVPREYEPSDTGVSLVEHARATTATLGMLKYTVLDGLGTPFHSS